MTVGVTLGALDAHTAITGEDLHGNSVSAGRRVLAGVGAATAAAGVVAGM